MKNYKFIKIYTSICACFLFLFISNTLYGQDVTSLAFSFGYFNVLFNDHKSMESRFEYRVDKHNSIADPLSGIMWNSDGAFYVYTGLMIDIYLSNNLIFTPSFAPGLYFKGKSIDLNFIIEYRSQVEITYRFNDNSRLGISFNHISNGSLGNSNPGVESLAVTYIFSI